jgi:hypothetical protein
LSDAGLRRRKTKLIYPNHRFSQWLNEDDTRDRSNRLLGGDAIAIPTKTLARLNHGISRAYPCSAATRLLSEQRQTGIEHEIQD